MGIRKYYWVIVLFFGMESHGQELTSDACHGEILTNLTRNVLKCEVSGTTICILEVRYYQFKESTGCPVFLSEDKPTPSRGCCIHDENSCSWISDRTDDREKLQRICQGLGECNLHSSSGRLVADPCVQTINLTLSSVSSVRSIKYTCIQNIRSCDDPGTTTTTRDQTEEISGTNRKEPAGVTEQNHDFAPKDGFNDGSSGGAIDTTTRNNSTGEDILDTQTDTGVIVGATLGCFTVGVLCLILVLVFIKKRRRRQKDNGLRGDPNTIAATERNPTHYVGGNGTSSFSPGVNAAYSSPFAPFDGYKLPNVVYNTLTGNTEDSPDYTQLEANTTDYINVPNKKKHGDGDDITANDRPDTMLNEMNEDTNNYMNVVSDNQEEGHDYLEIEQ